MIDDNGNFVTAEDGVIIPRVFLRAPYNYDTSAVSIATGLYCDPAEGMTQQQFKEETDINEIVRRFGLTGKMPDDLRVPMSGDFTNVTDFHTAMNAVREAEEAFMLMPSHVRARFNNDPQRLMEFVADGRNKEEALKMGLLHVPEEKPRDVVTAVDELAKVLTPKV